ncbi:unnamed protein product [Protopolystoma xenopodis]|uniref:USP domain-containing protein n=1 Tax=Protopolystoma xenopodis TaxID=117903 RepID=A0A448XBK0_9PLAT|nr:unnamed protein product [Protopolystoma xenopodis]
MSNYLDSRWDKLDREFEKSPLQQRVLIRYLDDYFALWSHVLNHSGQTNSGHYTAYIRAGPGTWCLCDDQKVLPVSLEHVLSTDAYVLLYHKNLLAVKA